MDSVKGYLCAILVWAVMWCTNLVLPGWHENTMNPPQARRGKLDVMLDLMGESRTLLARYLWFQADNYHEILAAQGVAVFQEADVMTMLRMVTYLDPKLDEAYDILAWDLFHGYGKPEDQEQAMKLLQEGLIYNPTSYKLYLRLAVMFELTQRFAEGVAPAEKAVTYASYDIEQLNALRTLYHCCAGVGRWEEALGAVDAILALRPQDGIYRQERVKVIGHLTQGPSR